MSSSFTYTTLETAIKDAIEDSGAEFEADFDVLLKLGEEMCVTDLALDIWKTNDTISLSSGTQTGTVPTGFLKIFAIFYTASSSRTFLERRNYEYLIDYWPSTSSTGTPLYWAPFSTTQIYVAPTPDGTYSCTARGLKRPTSLVTDTAGTWLSQNCGHLLYLATLIKSEQHNVSDERVPMWKTEYAEELSRKRVELGSLITPEYDDLPDDTVEATA